MLETVQIRWVLVNGESRKDILIVQCTRGLRFRVLKCKLEAAVSATLTFFT